MVLQRESTVYLSVCIPDRISNSAVPIVLDLNDGSATNGTAVTAWADNGGLNQLWLAEATGEADTFTLRNLAGGTYLDLEESSAADRRQSEVDHQEGYRRHELENYASKTFADLYNGGSSNGTPIYGWTGTKVELPAHERYKCRSTFGYQEQPSSGTKLSRLPLDGEYLILSADVWHQVWATTGLGQGNKVWRHEIFDCDDFAVTMKSGRFNCALLCGIMLGVNPNDPADAHAYNFNLANDHTGIVFYEHQTDQFLNDIGYNAYLAFF
ncbi:hypothetical protein D9615_000865 [Tricholomella constricta]|uniref:Uncharacterized protein n=1 Tax=Tricholomella constricta TaxID=117010 RepID=A0A8H5HRZ5_9AGAR|nr:hypothetical protein D9615_000865 [Tricholomella constricta]